MICFLSCRERKKSESLSLSSEDGKRMIKKRKSISREEKNNSDDKKRNKSRERRSNSRGKRKKSPSEEKKSKKERKHEKKRISQDAVPERSPVKKRKNHRLTNEVDRSFNSESD